MGFFPKITQKVFESFFVLVVHVFCSRNYKIFVLHQVSISGGEELIEQGHFGSANIQERIQEVSLSTVCPYFFPGLCITSFELGVEIGKNYFLDKDLK